jgi:hypothetical protein
MGFDTKSFSDTLLNFERLKKKSALPTKKWIQQTLKKELT